jgi:hypothetical protein
MRANPNWGARKRKKKAEGGGQAAEAGVPADIRDRVTAALKDRGSLDERSLARSLRISADDLRPILGSMKYAGQIDRHPSDGTYFVTE